MSQLVSGLAAVTLSGGLLTTLLHTNALLPTVLHAPTPPLPNRTVLGRADWSLDRTRRYDQHVEAGRCGIGKPVGLWYGFGTSWVDWCYSNRYGDPSRYQLHPVHFANPDRVLSLRTVEDVAAFKREFHDPTHGSFSNIRWGVVAAFFAGIEFPAYEHGWCFTHEEAASWTYGWDCASGCVWDLEAAGVQVVGEPQPVPPNPYPDDDEEDL